MTQQEKYLEMAKSCLQKGKEKEFSEFVDYLLQEDAEKTLECTIEMMVLLQAVPPNPEDVLKLYAANFTEDGMSGLVYYVCSFAKNADLLRDHWNSKYMSEKEVERAKKDNAVFMFDFEPRAIA